MCMYYITVFIVDTVRTEAQIRLNLNEQKRKE